MKANVTENTRRTMFGGTRYVVKASIALDPDEQAVVDKHDLKRTAIMDEVYLHDRRILASNLEMKALQKIGSGFADIFLRKPMEVEFDESLSVIAFRRAFDQGCERLKSRIELASEAWNEAPIAEGKPPSVAQLDKLTSDNIELIKKAIDCKDVDGVRHLLSELDESAINSSLPFFLSSAAMEGNTEIVKALLAAGADVNACSPVSGPSPLALASGLGLAEVVEELIAAGADVNGSDPAIAPLRCALLFDGDANTVEILLKGGADPNAKSKEGRTVLMVAAEEGKPDVVRCLLKAGADFTASDQDNKTALMCAAWKGNGDCAKLILDCGADVNAKHARSGTALMGASANGHLEAVKLLLEYGADINATSNGVTAKDMASHCHHSDVLELLEKSGG